MESYKLLLHSTWILFLIIQDDFLHIPVLLWPVPALCVDNAEK